MLASAIATALLLQGPRPEATCVDLSGKTVTPLARQSAGQPKAIVLIFYLAHCPISQKLTPEINRVYQEFYSKGVRIYMVHEDLTLTNKEVASHAKEFGLRPTVLIDKWRTQMRRSGATVSPEAVVYDQKLQMRYMGRINDLFYGLGKMRPKATSRDLRDAIASVLANKEGRLRRGQAIGCILPKI